MKNEEEYIRPRVYYVDAQILVRALDKIFSVEKIKAYFDFEELTILAQFSEKFSGLIELKQAKEYIRGVKPEADSQGMTREQIAKLVEGNKAYWARLESEDQPKLEQD